MLKHVRNNISDIESDQEKQRNAKRVYEFFNNLIRLDNVQKSVNTLVRDALQMVQSINDKNGDIVDILDCTDIISSQILTKEETLKLKILKDAENRKEIEEAFWIAQEYPIWNGEILPMIEWANTGGFCIDTFNSYNDIITTTFGDNCDSKIDDQVRRALLTQGLTDYPRIFRGNTNYSFGWRWSDWQTLIKDNKDNFKRFFDELLKGENLQSIIDNYNSEEDVFYRFVKYPELLAYCEQKIIQKWGKSYCLVKQQRATASNYLELETACLFLEISKNTPLESECDLGNGWIMCLTQGSSTLVFYNTTKTVIVHFDPQTGIYTLNDEPNKLSKADVLKQFQVFRIIR